MSAGERASRMALAAMLVFVGSSILASDFLLNESKFAPVSSLAVTFGLIATTEPSMAGSRSDQN